MEQQSPQPSQPEYSRRVYASARSRLTTTAITMRIALASAAAFLAIWAVLSVQMAIGSDPALGPKAASVGNQGTSTSSSSGSGSTSGSSSSTAAVTTPAPAPVITTAS